MTTTMALDYGLCYLFEQIFKYFFADSQPKAIAARTPAQLARERQRLELEASNAE